MSHDAHLDEIGAELDRLVRSSVMAASQLGENLARRVTNSRQAQAVQARQAFLDQRDAARRIYLPLTNKNAAAHATPAQLWGAWGTANAWAGRDPEAARAAAHLAGRLPPLQVSKASPLTMAPTIKTTMPVDTTDRAVALAQEHAPAYYTRHEHDRREENAEQLVADWSHWQQQGELPQRSVREEWARHTGRLDNAQMARDATPAVDRDVVYDTALEQAWAATAQLSDAQILSVAQEHAPAWYQRHHEDALATDTGAAQLHADWEHWRANGQLPVAARHEEWACYVGRGDEFAPELWTTPEDREAALQHVWDEGRDERGLLDMTQHLDQMREAHLDTDDVTAETLTEDLEQFRLDAAAARDVYTPLLDSSTFSAADQATALRAWEQAAGWSGQDPAAEAAAAHLDQQFRTRWQTSPLEHLLDQFGDQAANLTEQQRAGAALEAAGADREHADELRCTADDILDTPQTAGDHDEADQDREAADALDAGTGQHETKAGVEQEPRYRRIDESDLSNASPEAAEARSVSARSFSKTTSEMVQHAVEQNGPAATAKKYTRSGLDSGVERNQSR